MVWEGKERRGADAFLDISVEAVGDVRGREGEIPARLAAATRPTRRPRPPARAESPRRRSRSGRRRTRAAARTRRRPPSPARQVRDDVSSCLPRWNNEGSARSPPLQKSPETRVVRAATEIFRRRSRTAPPRAGVSAAGAQRGVTSRGADLPDPPQPPPLESASSTRRAASSSPTTCGVSSSRLSQSTSRGRPSVSHAAAQPPRSNDSENARAEKRQSEGMSGDGTRLQSTSGCQ